MEVSAIKHAGAATFGTRSPLLRLQSDERLVALVRRGNHGAFEALVGRYESRLLSFCRHMLGSREDAEDVLQEVFAAGFNALLADERAINVRPWLYRIARNRCLNHLRRAQPIGVDSMDVHLSENGLTTADKVHKREEFRLLIADVQSLPESQRTALLLREIDALSYDQIAEAMETTIPSIKSLLVRARVSLAECAEARALSCGEVRLELGEVAEGLRRVSPPVRRHLRECERCSAFRKQLRSTNKALAAVLPIAPWLVLKKTIVVKLGTSAGHGAGAAAGGAAGTTAGGAAAGALSAGLNTLASKAAAGLAAAAIVTAGAVEVKEVTSRDGGGGPIASAEMVENGPSILLPGPTGAPATGDRREPASAAGGGDTPAVRATNPRTDVIADARTAADEDETAEVEAPTATAADAEHRRRGDRPDRASRHPPPRRRRRPHRPPPPPRSRSPRRRRSPRRTRRRPSCPATRRRRPTPSRRRASPRRRPIRPRAPRRPATPAAPLSRSRSRPARPGPDRPSRSARPNAQLESRTNVESGRRSGSTKPTAGAEVSRGPRVSVSTIAIPRRPPAAGSGSSTSRP